MKFLAIVFIAFGLAIASVDHLNSYLYGLVVAVFAVGSCFAIASRSIKLPELSAVLFVSAVVAKLAIASVGVVWGLSNETIGSPVVFSMSYLLFSVAIVLAWRSVRKQQERLSLA